MLEATLKEVEEWLNTYSSNKEESSELTPESPSLLLRELIQTVKEGREPNSMPLYRWGPIEKSSFTQLNRKFSLHDPEF